MRDEDNTPHFALSRAFLDCKDAPKVGWQVEFTPLPKGPGRLNRATEVAIIPGTAPRRPEVIAVRRSPDGGLRIVLHRNNHKGETIARLLLSELA